MLDLIEQTKNSIKAYATAMRMLSSNIQNFQTDGYKSAEYSFQTLYTSALKTNSSQGAKNINLASSMQLLSEGIDFTQGSIGPGSALNAAISGQSLFVVKGNDDKNYAYKRASDFNFNNQGYLVDSLGRQVYGYKINSTGDVDKSQMVPIKIDPQTYLTNDLGFESDGILMTNYQARKTARDQNDPNIPSGKPLYQLALAKFSNPSGLSLISGNAFEATKASGKALAYGVSSDPDFGKVSGGYKENSNVDAAESSIEGVQLQRGYNAVQSAMTMINRLLSDFLRAVAQ